jgi:membrane protein YdbS with pleckstrin-like domain
MRRRLKKLRLLLVILGALSLISAVVVLGAGYFVASENGWARWVKFSAGHAVFGAACFLVRGVLLLRDRLRHSWRV